MLHRSGKPPAFLGGSIIRRTGTRFGYRGGMVKRQRDRRHGLGDILSALIRTLDRQSDVSLMRGAFEDLVRRLVPVRTAQLRDANSRWSGRTDSGGGLESVVLDVPGADPAVRHVLEASFDPGNPVGEWEFQMLGHLAKLAAFVLEIERIRLQLLRHGLLDTTRHKREQAPVLVGATPPMQALRATIERVAITDFTVLLEGESCAELASQFRYQFAPSFGNG